MRKHRFADNLLDRRKELTDIHSAADYEAMRKKNLVAGYWACVCGSRKFMLQQQAENVKAICAKCNNIDILYWNGKNDSTMRRLDTNKWVKPTLHASIIVE